METLHFTNPSEKKKKEQKLDIYVSSPIHWLGKANRAEERWRLDLKDIWFRCESERFFIRNVNGMSRNHVTVKYLKSKKSLSRSIFSFFQIVVSINLWI